MDKKRSELDALRRKTEREETEHAVALRDRLIRTVRAQRDVCTDEAECSAGFRGIDLEKRTPAAALFAPLKSSSRIRRRRSSRRCSSASASAAVGVRRDKDGRSITSSCRASRRTCSSSLLRTWA